MLQQGKLAKELDFVSHHVRTKLDELKRQEVNRLRTLIKAKQDIEGGNGMLCDKMQNAYFILIWIQKKMLLLKLSSIYYKENAKLYIYTCLFMPPIAPWIDIAVDHQALLKQFEYLNHMNPHTFEVDDLDRLIKSVNLIATPCYEKCQMKAVFTLFTKLNWRF